MTFFCVKTRIFATKVHFLLGDAKLFHRFNSSENIKKRVCQNSHPLLKYHKARTFTSSGFAIPYFFCTFMERNF